MNEKDILKLIQDDKWMMQILITARDLSLPQWIIGAGFVRNKVWDHLSSINRDVVDTRDIDLVYYDQNGNDEKADEKLSAKLKLETGIEWEVVNEYYAHKWNDLPLYTSTEDAISQWPETVTAIGVTVDKNNNLKLYAPYGIDDLVNFVIRPTPKFEDKIDKIKERMQQKKWSKKWPKVKLAI